MAFRARKVFGSFEKRTPGQLSFSRLLNPDWSIQISCAPAALTFMA